MYSLEELFRNTKHSSSIFSADEITAIEDAITLKGSVPYIKCLIRKKDVRLTPEEAVRQLYIHKLINDYGYSTEQIRLEHAIHFGREVKRADIVIFEKEHPDSEYIIAEVKKPKLTEGKEQLRSYCNATGAIIGVWTNGEDISYYHRKEPNHFENIPDIPNSSQKLRDILRERWTMQTLADKDRLRDGKKSLKALIQEMEDEVLANAGVDVFEEVFKLIYTKLYDEQQSGRDNSRVLEFRNYGDTDEDLKTNIQALFNLAKKKWPGVFDDKATISLTPSHLAVCVSSLQDVKLFNSNLDVVDDAFEYLMNKSQKGEKGQFFTPRYVIDMCVKMLNPSEDESMIDTAAVSCGFPVHTIFYVWRKILAAKGLPQSHLFTAEKKPPECEDYVRDKVFAIDFDEKTVRVARTLNLIAGDGKTNVLHLNTLDYAQWGAVVGVREWQKLYMEGWLRFTDYCENEDSYKNFMFDIVMANPPFAGDIKEKNIIMKYELSKNSQDKYASKVGRDILFIERNLEFLKPGGRMAIILPQGRFNNSTDKYIRDFIAERCRILAVIGLHGNVFKPHTGTKTSVLLVQKWDDELCPRRDDYPVFFATMRKPGKDNSGEKIYRKNADGSILMDGHNHPVIEHDLFSVELKDNMKTEDGIAEAFIEFAEREGLSFFGDAHSPERYAALMNGLECSEVMLSGILASERMDAEYYSREHVSLYQAVKTHPHIVLGDIAEVTDGIHTSIDYDDNSRINLISATSPRYNYFDLSRGAFISAKAHNLNPRTALRKDDVILSTVGTIGNCAVVTDDILPANTDRHVAIIRVKRLLLPNVLACFLLSKYGRNQTHRETTGNVQPNLFVYKVKELIIPEFSREFQAEIDRLAREAHTMRVQSAQFYAQAQTLLTDALNFTPSAISRQNTAVKSFSEAFSAGRLDAEFFMPMYKDYLDILGRFETTTIPAEYDTYKNSGTDYSDTSRDVGVIKTKQLTNRGVNTDGVESWFDSKTCEDHKSIFLQKGDVVFASMGVGSLGKVSMFTYDEDKPFVTDSTLRIYRAKYNPRVLPEVLCMFIQSEIGQKMIYRYVVGSTGIINIYDRDIAKIPVPVLPIDIQRQIDGKVQESFRLRRLSGQLIAQAVKSVELEVERR